ncbi:DEP domain-containing protein 7 [Leucoraja erinacea]|uniref:DEP domain-containing protein 7 n=1 Tax=Leucoraja erinaceus TaxID=7782 RepID=UPI002457C491|nr:DEP domain-containing protein 7 [Leucoraja erinacea]
MTTVRERAQVLSLNLNLAALSPAVARAALPTVDPFRATRIWCNIIIALQSEVEVKRRRHNLKRHNDCFLGSDAVDLILSHLLQNKYFDAEITRSKVVRLCQALMDNKVFEGVGTKLFGKVKKESTFEDSSYSLYRFTALHKWVDSVKDNGSTGLSPGAQLTPGYNSWGSRPVDFPTSDAGPPDSSLAELLDHLSLMPVNSSRFETSRLPPTVVSEIWQEQTILRLLQLIELPILDSLLDRKEQRPNSQNSSNDAVTSSLLDREILKAYGDSQDSEWLSAAIGLLEYLPDVTVVEISRNFPEPSCDVDQCKMMFFDAIAKHYSQTKEPLLTNDLFDIHTGVTELIGACNSIPASLHKMVSEKLMNIQCGRDPDLSSVHSFCERLSHSACESNMRKTTRDELLLLLKTIDENAQLSAKEKKKVLTQFNRSHPAIFIQYFFDPSRKL